MYGIQQPIESYVFSFSHCIRVRRNLVEETVLSVTLFSPHAIKCQA